MPVVVPLKLVVFPIMRIALVEDDPAQAQLMESWLGEAGFSYSRYTNADGFLKSIAKESYDLLIVDWMLPDLDGLEVIDRYRSIANGGPAVMVVTVKDKESDAVNALGKGADEYLRKPLRHREFVARVKALTRRTQIRNLADLEPFEIDLSNRRLSLHGKPLKLTAREFDMALFLFQRRDQLVSRNHILESIWGNNRLLLSRTVDTHISRLRKKLGLDGSSGWRLISVYRRGYSLQKVT